MFFFFQAEDGIRDVAVTGVQTCALPISLGCAPQRSGDAPQAGHARQDPSRLVVRIGRHGTLRRRWGFGCVSAGAQELGRCRPPSPPSYCVVSELIMMLEPRGGGGGRFAGCTRRDRTS